MKYRREIDGLRAVAVIPVILFHAGFEAFRGGFVGVDVFFVISGYLITTIILSEKERGSFSIINFYERRIRRILPAMFLVMLACLPFAWFWMLPADMQAFSNSLTAVSTFSSNILFWRTSGYWGIPNEFVPLLHTWSLAVEEQYYVLFPLFLMLMWRFPKRWILFSFLAVAASSLFLAHWGAYHYPAATFFLLITRGWELAVGASIAFYFLYRKRTVRKLRSHRVFDESMSTLGVLLIGYAVFVFDETVPFPSLYALVPTIGTGLIIIFSSAETIVGRLLGVKLLVGIGLISYSAYLWHQPLFAFARYRSMTSPDTVTFLSLSSLAIFLAFLSWRFVEKPFRTKGTFSRRTIFAFAGTGSAFFIAVGLAGYFSAGWPERIDAALRYSIETATAQHPDDQSCIEEGRPESALASSCTLSSGNSGSAYLIGDSHADAISGEIKRAFEDTDIGLIRVTERGCPPVLDVHVFVTDKYRCFNHNKEMYRYLETRNDIEYIILVARWAFYLESGRFNNGEGGVEPDETIHFGLEPDERPSPAVYQNRIAEFSAAYTESLTRLAESGKKLIVVYPIPEAGWNVPRYVRNYYFDNPDGAFLASTGSTSYDAFRARNDNSYEALNSIGEYPNLIRVYPENIFCNAEVKHRCIVQKDGSLLYMDDDHLSSAGARLVTNEIMQHIEL